MSIDSNRTGSTATKRATWIMAMSLASALALHYEAQIPTMTRTASRWIPELLGVAWLISGAVALLVALATPWFETVMPRRKVVAGITAAVGLGSGATVALAPANQAAIAWIVLVPIVAALARFLSTLDDVAYVGLLRHEERVKWYLLKPLGAGLAAALFASMKLSSSTLRTAEESVNRGLLGVAFTLPILAALLAWVLPEFGERDAPMNRSNWSKAVTGAIAELRALHTFWPTVVVFVLLPLPINAVRRVVPFMLLQSQVDGGFGLSNMDVGLTFGTFGGLASMVGLLCGWLLLRRTAPQRFVRIAIVLSMAGVVAWSVLAASRPTNTAWLVTTASLDNLCQSFCGVVVLLLTMQTLGTLRFYATGFVWVITAIVLSGAALNPLVDQIVEKFGTAGAIHALAIATFFIGVGAAALWSRHLPRTTT